MSRHAPKTHHNQKRCALMRKRRRPRQRHPINRELFRDDILHSALQVPRLALHQLADLKMHRAKPPARA